MTELGLIEKIQKFDNFRRSESEENLFLNFFKITEAGFFVPAAFPH